MPRRHPYGAEYQRARERLLAEGGPCAYGCGRPATEADHQPPLSMFADPADWVGELVPSCFWCARSQGGLLARGREARRDRFDPADEPVGFPVDDPVWDRSWLDDLREVPADARWPRLMTAPHPDAEGSWGGEFVEWVRVELGITFRWWQRLFGTRLLEHDGADRLLWTTVLLTLARQCGKSLLVYCLCEWRSEQADRFGEPQLVLHTADTIEHARAVWTRAHARAVQKGFGLRRAAGEYEIAKPGGLWLVRSQTAAIGYTAALAVADECHAVDPVTVNQGLGPTLVEAAQSQLLLVSTAHSKCTDMFPLARAGALASLGEPGVELLVEWSAPRGTSVLDPEAARLASPHWHPRRAQDIQASAQRAAVFEGQPHRHELVVGHVAQWHNEWRVEGTSGKGEPLVDREQWAAAFCDVDTVGPGVIAVEDRTGQGAAAAFCGIMPDGRWVFGGQLCVSRAEAYLVAGEWARSRPGSILVVGASLFADAEVAEIPVAVTRRAGSTETTAALSRLRELLGTGRVTHDGSPELEQQALAARVVVGAAGLSLVAGGRTDLLRAGLWALQVAVTEQTARPRIDWVRVDRQAS